MKGILVVREMGTRLLRGPDFLVDTFVGMCAKGDRTGRVDPESPETGDEVEQSGWGLLPSRQRAWYVNAEELRGGRCGNEILCLHAGGTPVITGVLTVVGPGTPVVEGGPCSVRGPEWRDVRVHGDVRTELCAFPTEKVHVRCTGKRQTSGMGGGRGTGYALFRSQLRRRSDALGRDSGVTGAEAEETRVEAEKEGSGAEVPDRQGSPRGKDPKKLQMSLKR